MLQNVVQFQGYQQLESPGMCPNLPGGVDREPGKVKATRQTIIEIQEIKAMRIEIEELPLEGEEKATEEMVVVVETIEGEVVVQEEVKVCFNVHLVFIKDHPVHFRCLRWIIYFLITKI